MSEKSVRDSIVEELLKDWPIFDLLSFNEFDIQDRVKDHAYVLMRYQDQLNTERYNYERLEMLYDKVKGEQYHYYKFEMDESLQKSEIEQYYLPADKKLLKIKAIMQNQKIRVQFFEAAVNALSKQGWSFKNFLQANNQL